MKVDQFLREAATDMAILTGVGLVAAAAIGGVPLIAAGAAISCAIAGPAVLIGKVASHVINQLDHKHKYNVLTRTLKVLFFGIGLAAGAGIAAGIACIPALGLTVATAASIIGAVALAATVGYVAYLALRGICNLASSPKPTKTYEIIRDDDDPIVKSSEQQPPKNNKEKREYIKKQFINLTEIDHFYNLNSDNISTYINLLSTEEQRLILTTIEENNNKPEGVEKAATAKGLIQKINEKAFPVNE